MNHSIMTRLGLALLVTSALGFGALGCAGDDTGPDEEDGTVNADEPVDTTGDALTGISADAVSAHNASRSKHHAANVVWDNTIAQGAQAYANTCALKHSGAKGLGENLGWGYGNIKGAINAWVSEEKNYNYGNPGFGSNTGHFTQVVWKGTTRIGCGVAQCPSIPYKNMEVCRYAPPGNVLGQFPQNVQKP